MTASVIYKLNGMNRFMIYTLLKEKVVENTNLVTFSYILLTTYIYCS